MDQNGSSSNAVASSSALPSAAPSPLPPTAKQLDIEAKDRSLADLMLMLDDYEPLIPEEVTTYFLQKAGFETNDPRLKRLLSLAAQKFVSDIATDSYHYARIRTNAQGAARGRPPGGGGAAAAAAAVTAGTAPLPAATAGTGAGAGGAGGGAPATAAATAAAAAAAAKDKSRTVLTMDDLTAALGERGVHLNKPAYFQ